MRESGGDSMVGITRVPAGSAAVMDSAWDSRRFNAAVSAKRRAKKNAAQARVATKAHFLGCRQLRMHRPKMAEMTVKRETSRPIQAAEMERRASWGRRDVAQKATAYSSTASRKGRRDGRADTALKKFQRDPDDKDCQQGPADKTIARSVEQQLVETIEEIKRLVGPTDFEFRYMDKIPMDGEEDGDCGGGDGECPGRAEFSLDQSPEEYVNKSGGEPC